MIERRFRAARVPRRGRACRGRSHAVRHNRGHWRGVPRKVRGGAFGDVAALDVLANVQHDATELLAPHPRRRPDPDR